ncbi:hypothetical protein KUTeg_014654 [Tegillarca granosa]|uniref:Glycolipid transfer protein domain-containing protein n=1 Tax=Tegillarca granosa TaxID=220873 RepID=A0ABQ9ERD6_TEGGR|nr:hypothetical protein KUTeg_014654 [Tegillarca granosa]
MEFTAQIMADIKESDEHGKMSSITSHAYDTTLAKHHPWLIRKAVHVAVYTLPKRQHLLEKMKLHDEAEAKEYLGKAVTLQQDLFRVIEDIYAKEKLLDLP